MKKLSLLGVLLVMASFTIAQCNLSSVSKISTGRFIQNNAKQPDFPFEGTLTIDKEKILLKGSIAGQSLNISNNIQKVTVCEWKEYLKNGQAIYKVSTDKGNGIFENSIIRLTAKDGKVTILFTSEADEKNGLELDTYENWIEKT